MRIRVLSFSLVCVFASATAIADPPGLWPAFRHDGQRTGRATESGAVTNPSVAWTLPIGGTLASSQTTLADLDGDGRTEVVMASAGGVIARHADDTVVSRSGLFGADFVYGVWNLDNVGPPEIVAHGASPRGVYVLDGMSGAVRLFVPATNQTVGATPVAHPGGGIDLVVRDYTTLGTLALYRTSSSFAATPAWTASINDYDVDRSVTVADIDGDGNADLVAPTDRGFDVFDASTGALEYNANTVTNASYTPAYYYGYIVADVDGRPGAEIISLDVSYYYSEDAAITVMGVRPGGSGSTLQVLWQRYAHNDVTPGSGNDVGRHFYHLLADGVADLDHDGTTELVFSEWDGSTTPGTWTSYVVDGATGAEIARRTAMSVEAVADLDGDGKLEVVTRDATDANTVGNTATPLFSTLHAFDFDSRTSGLAPKPWSLANAAVVQLAAYRRPRGTLDLGGYFGDALSISAHQDIDDSGDPAEELYVYYDAQDEFANQQRPTHVEAIHGTDGAVRAQYPIPMSTFASVLALGHGLASSTTHSEALVGDNDGRARVISNRFIEAGAVTEGNYDRLPSVVSLDGTHALIAVVQSTEFLALIDGTQSVGTQPHVPARIEGVMQPESRGYVDAPGAVLPEVGGGRNDLVVRAHSHNDWQDTSLVAVTATGSEHWRVEVGHRRSIAGFDNAEVADFTGDGVADLFTTEINEMGGEEVIVRDGHDASIVRQLAVGPALSMGSESVTVGAYLQGHAIWDVNGDHVPDVLSALHPQWFVALDVSGVAIRTLWIHQNPASQIVNGQAMIAPMAADGSPRILRANSQNAFGPYTRFALDGTIDGQVAPVAVTPNRDAVDQNNAAFIAHAGTPVRYDFVTAGMAAAATGLLVRYDGLTMTPAWQEFLSNGMVSSTTPANVAALYDPIVVDVDGDHNDDIVVGSDDGYLYALHGDGSMLFALNLHNPVVHVIAANLDTDPALELLCSRSDGSLVAIDDNGAYAWTPLPMPDAGAEPMPDSGTDASVSDVFDAGPHDAGGSEMTTGRSSGCGCRAVGVGERERSLALLAWVLAAVGARRRTRRAWAAGKMPRAASRSTPASRLERRRFA